MTALLRRLLGDGVLATFGAAREAIADDDDQYRAEFVELVEAVVRSELLAAR